MKQNPKNICPLLSDLRRRKSMIFNHTLSHPNLCLVKITVLSNNSLNSNILNKSVTLLQAYPLIKSSGPTNAPAHKTLMDI